MKIPTVGDLFRLGTEQVEALVALPESLALLNRSLTNFAATVSRLDTLVQRLDRLTEPLEEPLTALAPRLNALVPLLDEEVLASLPAVLDSVNRNAVPALEVIGQTQAQVASIASSVERLMHVMDDTFTRLQELPGMGLVTRLRSGADRSSRGSGSGRGSRAAGAGRAGDGPPSGAPLVAGEEVGAGGPLGRAAAPAETEEPAPAGLPEKPVGAEKPRAGKGKPVGAEEPPAAQEEAADAGAETSEASVETAPPEDPEATAGLSAEERARATTPVRPPTGPPTLYQGGRRMLTRPEERKGWGG